MLNCFKSLIRSKKRADHSLLESDHTRTIPEGKEQYKGAKGERRSWLQIDSEGTLSLQEVDTQVAAAKFGIPERDVSLVEPQEGGKLCPVRLAVRGRALLVCLEGLRLVVSRDQALLLSVPPQAGSLQQCSTPFSDNLFVRDLISRLRIGSFPDRSSGYVDKSLAFELVVLEWALATATKLLAEVILAFEQSSTPVLEELVTKVSSKNIASLRHLKYGAASLTARAERLRQELLGAMGEPDRLAKPRAGRASGQERKQQRRRARQRQLLLDPKCEAECSSLLESYLIQVDAALSVLRGVRSSSGSAEGMAKLSVKLQRLRLGRC